VPARWRAPAYAAVYLLLMSRVVGLTVANLVNGLALGALYGVVGVALVLIYRTTRIINFAAAALGALPAITALLMVTTRGVNYALALPIAALGGLLVGGLTDVFVMRRFATAPRLIVTVVTIGVAQSYAALGFFIPVWFGATASQIPKVPTPWGDLAWRDGRGQPILNGDQIFAFAMVLLLTLGLALFLKRSQLGVALRASAENADRAALLGIPVRKVSTIAWAFAGLLSGLVIFAQAPLIGVPSDATLGYETLLYGLAAAVVARMDRMMLALGAGMAIGLLIFASVARTGSSNIASALMLVVILGALLMQRGSLSRAQDTGVSTWRAVKAFRPIPVELRSVPEIVRWRVALSVLAMGVAVGAPFAAGGNNVPTLTVLPLWGIVAVSLVVLTGWAGQISLGQFGLVGIGAAVAGGLVANHNIDFFAAVALGIAAGGAAAVLIGLPAIRIQGLYLAVTTMAFGYAMQNYVLNKNYWIGRHLMPSGLSAHLARPVLYGRIDLENDRSFYYVCVVCLALCIAAALAFRRYRSGRVVIAVRDNHRAAASYAISPVRARLAAFAVSGALAGLAGVLFAYQQHNVYPASYDVTRSVTVFLAACIAGLASVWVCVVGVIAIEAAVLFGPNLWNGLLTDHQTINSVMPLLLTGPLLVLNLYSNPGGLAESIFAVRDRYLRKVAERRDIVVPSLVADRQVDEHEAMALVDAERTIERLATDDEPRIQCPVCRQVLTLPDVTAHEHLQAAPVDGAVSR
jgi:branched-chain amino acid transport system permease protein